MAIATRKAEIVWEGPLASGTGTLSGGSGALGPLPVTWASRTERPHGKTSPEELIAAAHASCFAMALSLLEALLALRDLAGDRVELTLISPEPEFVYRPMAIAEPFGRGRADRHRLASIASDLDAELMPAALVEVEADRRVAITAEGERIPYDALLVAVGAGSEPAFRRVLTWTRETDSELLGGLLRDLEEGYTERVAFVVLPGVAWALPAYELALMRAWQAWGMVVRARLEPGMSAEIQDAVSDLDELEVEDLTRLLAIPSTSTRLEQR